MQRIDGHLVLSPTDLTKHVACAHITTLDLEALDAPFAGGTRPSGADDSLNLVFAKGLDHERAYLEQLRSEGRVVEDVAALGVRGAAAEAATLEAMRRGVDVVYQATFYDGHWVGLADFLLRVDLSDGERSDLGPWRYDIADTKLARRLKVPALLQMATYAARLETLQGVPPQWLTVVTGDTEAHPWRLVDVAPYARRRRAELLDAIANPRQTESARVQHCGQCRWKERCAQEWLDRDDLIQVAGMRADHRAALIDLGIPTLRALAESSEEQLAAGLSVSTRRRLLQQARLQVAERDTGQAQYELLAPEPARGLQMLPEPDEGDVYLDFEGDPWAEGGAGREYLAGIWTRQGEFVAFWAHDFAEEGSLTTQLVDWLTERWQRHPGFHVYHYAPYETTALKRLVGQHATREAELDQLLRHEVFVDLYAVVRQGVRISKGSYSIKKLEEFYWGHTRKAQGDGVADGLSSVVEYERWLAGRDEGHPDQTILDDIRRYNEEDVRSTLALHDWLEERRRELERAGHMLARPVPEQLRPISDEERAEIDLAERLVESGRPGGLLLAGLVGWHRREKRPEWWDFFRYKELETAELVEDATAIGDLGEPVPMRVVKLSRVWRYPFPPQDCKVSVGKYVPDVDTHVPVGKVVDLDPVEGWIELSMKKSLEPPRPRGLGGPGPVMDQVLRASIARTGQLALEGGTNLATRLIGRVVPTAEALAVRDGESPKDVVVRVGRALDGEVLAVQGPPGTGKTYAGSALIRELLDAGLRVGVTAQSHAVVLHLLDEVARPAWHKDGTNAEEGVEPDDPNALIRHTSDNAEIAAALASGEARLVGGTAWLWSRDDMVDAVDVLVIDEAGQFSLANAVAVAPSARSLVLLGDPQQLTQPTKAVHPYGSGVSALDHLRTGDDGVHDVIPADRGVFLDRTHRMHPTLTAFVSELAYEGRLESAPGRERLSVDAPGALSGDGLRWVPVEHERLCEQSSPQEAAVVRDLLADLLRGTWTTADGETKPVELDDVLVVAPYNAHVATLAAALPEGARVGTVDKFQGQQGAVVIYSMASTTAALAPRGVSFLYDLHRLNVAISRARAMAVVVGSPMLTDAAVHTPEELRAVNALCRYVDEAKTV
ncbi:TM0106 family RecB-like putative nuclease [Terrabacter sp. GCM10028922]|uniref:TM0106 family RecB-like putative nuclease n=1 Tax=Terrabacter sp. GCM10028922 TaxID=3273428 RepID=UPI0036061D97